MRTPLSVLLIAVFAAVPVQIVDAQPAFQGLGDLPGGGAESLGLAVSGDGSTVVGASPSQSSGSYREAFDWTWEAGMEGLGDFPDGYYESVAHDVSSQGTVVVGRGSPGDAYQAAAMWTADRTMVRLGSLYGGNTQSEAMGVSSDGSVIVGWSSDTSGNPHAFRWTNATGMQHLTGVTSLDTATAVSGDGQVVMGYGHHSQAFRWTAQDGIQRLGTLGGAHRSFAWGSSYDGSIIVGHSGDGINADLMAFRWTAQGGMVPLEPLAADKECAAFDVSSDASVIVGSAMGVDYGWDAVIWDDAHGVRNLENVLSDLGLDLTGWALRTARGVSADGLTITGYGTNPSGRTEAWVARLPEPGSLALLVVGGLALLLRCRRTTMP